MCAKYIYNGIRIIPALEILQKDLKQAELEEDYDACIEIRDLITQAEELGEIKGLNLKHYFPNK
jgi:hypothetical protein